MENCVQQHGESKYKYRMVAIASNGYYKKSNTRTVTVIKFCHSTQIPKKEDYSFIIVATVIG